MMLELYNKRHPEASFLDYFWTYRFTHLPICNVINAPLPRAKVYHTICTGFAGLMAVLASLRMDRPMLLTEHGIYTKERKIEVAQSKWIHTEQDDRLRIERDLGTFRTSGSTSSDLEPPDLRPRAPGHHLFEATARYRSWAAPIPSGPRSSPTASPSRYENLKPRADS
jgi:hypothetical protein